MDAIINLLALATIAAQIFLAISLVSCLFDIQSEKMFHFVTRRRLMLAFLTALTATLGSLFFSEIAGFVPASSAGFKEYSCIRKRLFSRSRTGGGMSWSQNIFCL